MKNVHLSDEEIQTIVFEQTDFNSFNEHIRYCIPCKNKIEAYKLIFADLHKHSQPVFNFEIQAPVLVRSQAYKRNLSYIPIYIFITLVFVLLTSGVLNYIFKKQFEKFDNAIPLNWFIIFIAGILLVGLLVDLAIGHEKKIKALNRSIMQH